MTDPWKTCYDIGATSPPRERLGVPMEIVIKEDGSISYAQVVPPALPDLSALSELSGRAIEEVSRSIERIRVAVETLDKGAYASSVATGELLKLFDARNRPNSKGNRAQRRAEAKKARRGR